MTQIFGSKIERAGIIDDFKVELPIFHVPLVFAYIFRTIRVIENIQVIIGGRK